MSSPIIRPGRFPGGDRQIEELSRGTQTAVADLESRLAALEAPAPSRIVAPDRFTELWYQCFEAPGAASVANFGRTQAPALLRGSGCAPAPAGLVSRYAIRCGTSASDANNHAGAGVSGPTFGTTVTISAWARVSASGTPRIIFSYYADPPSFSPSVQLYVDGATRLPIFTVMTGAGFRSITGTSDMEVSPGSWHLLGGAYDGTTLSVFNDGLVASQAFSASPINWATGGSPRWRIGFPGSASTFKGCVQDIRLHSVVRSAEWFRDMYGAGMGIVQ